MRNLSSQKESFWKRQLKQETEQKYGGGQGFGQGQSQRKVQSRQPRSPVSSRKPDFRGLSQELGIEASQGLVIQPKLTIGTPNDEYEQEADRVATQVVQQLKAPNVERSPTDSVGRSLEKHPQISDLQMKPLRVLPQQEAIGTGENLQIARLPAGAIVSGDVSNDLETAINDVKGRGRPLEANLQRQMGQAMGSDFRGVKVHTDSTADRLSRSIQAKAFTAGKNIFFKSGEYQPESYKGQELIAHELAHVVQQGFIPKTIQRQEDGEEDKTKEKKPEKKREIPKTLEGLAYSLEAVVEICDKNDEKLLEVLKSPLEANWSLARNCLLMNQWPIPVPMPSREASKQLMQSLVGMRGRKWDEFAAKTKPLIKDKVQQVAETRRRSIFKTTYADLKASSNAKLDIGEAVGSQSVTSDIDLALKGDNTEIGVELINEEFRKEFNVPFDPGTVFDINVYSLDWMHGQTEVKEPENNAIATFNPEPEKRSQLSDQKVHQERNDRLEIWSLVKIRRNLNEVQWERFQSEILTSISEGRDSKAMQDKLSNADQEYKQFQEKVKTTLTDMVPQLEEKEARQLGYQKLNDKEKAHLRQALGRSYVEYEHEHHSEAQEMRASNKIYQEIILQVRNLRLQLDRLQSSPLTPENHQLIAKLSNQLSDTMAAALTYANEVYATEGAVLHTVYGKQGAAKKLEKLRIGDPANNIPPRPNLTAVKFNLTPQHYLQSVNENVGDALHSLDHYKTQPAYAVYRAGKYLERLCEAADYLLGAAKDIPQYGHLYQIGQEAVRAKSGAVGQDPMEIYGNSFFVEFINDKDLNNLKNQIIAFAAQVSAIFYSRSARQATNQGSAQEGSSMFSRLMAVFSQCISREQ